jgi:very-short-patch-repair endonuclease
MEKNGKWKACKVCGKKFYKPASLSHIAHCSMRCGQITKSKKMHGNNFGFKKGHKINFGRWQTEQTKEKLRGYMDEQYHEGFRDRFGITKKANKKTRMLAKKGLLPIQRPDVQLKAMKAARKKEGTYIEKKVAWLLEKKGLVFESQKIFKRQQSFYRPDFFLPNHKLVIECDGEYWHKDKAKESLRDCFFESKGLKVVHFGEKEIRTDLPRISEEIDRHTFVKVV